MADITKTVQEGLGIQSSAPPAEEEKSITEGITAGSGSADVDLTLPQVLTDYFLVSDIDSRDLLVGSKEITSGISLTDQENAQAFAHTYVEEQQVLLATQDYRTIEDVPSAVDLSVGLTDYVAPDISIFIVSPTPSSYKERESLTFSATVMDGTEEAEHTLWLKWYSSRDGFFKLGNDFTHSCLSVGTHVITVFYYNDRKTTQTVSITITENTEPSKPVT